MNIFTHHIYEYRKGLRRLVLHTAAASDRSRITRKLDGLEINYIIHSVNEMKINVFFGDPWCIGVIRSFSHLDLWRLTDEQDFILGTLLGYDMVIQCRRYLQRIGSAGPVRCNGGGIHQRQSAVEAVNAG